MKCTDCSLYENVKTPCLKGRGKKRTIMLVGEAPGFQEDEQGMPFVGRAGLFLNQSLKEVSLNRDDFYVTNAVKCRPPSNRTPTKGEINACYKHLEREIKRVKPKYIVTLGNIPLTSLTKKSGILKYRGSLIKQGKLKIFPMLHPAAVLRNPRYMGLFKNDLISFRRIINGERRERSKPKYKVEIIKTLDELKGLVRKLNRSNYKYLAYDIESGGLNWKTDPMWMLGIATSRRRAYIIPLEHPQSPFKNCVEQVFKIIKPLFENKSKFFIAHNGKFDNKFLRIEGIKPYQNWDTMLASHLLDENSPNGLEYLSITMLNTTDYKKKYGIVFNVDFPSPLTKMGNYCGEDCCNTFGIFKIQKEILEDDPRLESVFYNLKMPASRLFEKVEMNGIWINANKLHRNGKIISKRVMEIEKELNRLIPKDFNYQYKIYKTTSGFQKALNTNRYGKNPKWKKVDGCYYIRLPFNWGSTQQLAQLLFTSKDDGGWGLKPPNIKEALTKGGSISTGEATLAYLRGKHPGIDKLVEYKEWRQLRNNFIIPWKEKLDAETSRLYPTFKLHGTLTHRLSSENPNPQQTPRNKLIRGLVGAPPGRVFIEADYSQIELRVAALISG